MVVNRPTDAIESLRHAFQIDPAKRRLFEEEFPGVKSVKEFRHLLMNRS
jgi:hypothetical protein